MPPLKLRRGVSSVAPRRATSRSPPGRDTPARSRSTSATTARRTFSFRRPDSRENRRRCPRSATTSVSIDESNGSLHRQHPDDDRRRRRQRHDRRQAETETLLGGDGNDDRSTATGQRPGLLRRRATTLRLGSGRRQRHGRGPGTAPTRCRFNRRNARRAASTCPPNGKPAAGFFRDVGNITMDTAGVERGSTSTRSAGRDRSASDLSPAPASVQRSQRRPRHRPARRRRTGDARGQTAWSSTAPPAALRSTVKIRLNASGVAVSGLRTAVAIQHREPTDQNSRSTGSAGDDASRRPRSAAGGQSRWTAAAGGDTIAGAGCRATARRRVPTTRSTATAATTTGAAGRR